jgi:hypothetical protein
VSDRDPDDDLRRAFGALGERARAAGDCPAPERIWDAAAGVAPQAEVHAIVEHTARCAACAEDWRLARGIEQAAGEEAGPRESPGVRERERIRPRAALPIAASVILAAATAVYVARRAGEPSGSGYRTAPTDAIRSLLEQDRVLPRDRCQLRWSAAPEGSRYDVIVTTRKLDPVLESRDLAAPELGIPESVLDTGPGGGDLLWRVEATLPDGRRMVSATFSATCR